MSLSSFLQHELQQLVYESKRRYPEVKEAAEKQLALIKVYKGRSDVELVAALSSSADTLRPVLLACHTRHPKITTIAICCLQQLVTRQAFPSDLIPTATTSLSEAIETAHPDVQVKVLQCVLPLLSNFPDVHDDELVDILDLCFRVQNSKYPLVQSVAAATLRQVVGLVFERAAVPGITDPAKELRIQDACQLFQDLCLLTNGEAPNFLHQDFLSPTIGLELIEAVLSAQGNLFRTNKRLGSLLREELCPIVIRHHASTAYDFVLSVRLVRLVRVVVRQFVETMPTECEVFLSMMLKQMDPASTELMQRILALEFFQSLVNDFGLLRAIYVQYERQHGTGGLFYDLVVNLSRFASETPDVTHSSGAGANGGAEAVWESMANGELPSNIADAGLSVRVCSLKLPCLEQLEKTEAPALPLHYAHFLAMNALMLICESLADFIIPVFTAPATSSSSLATSTNKRAVSPAPTPLQLSSTQVNSILTSEIHPARDGLRVVGLMSEMAWPAVLASFSAYFLTRLDDDLFNKLLHGFQQFTSVLGLLNLATPRDAFLTTLCKHALPVAQSTTASIPERHMSCLVAVLNLANLLGGTLTNNAWKMILSTLEQVDLLLHGRYMSTPAKTPASRKTAAALVRAPSPQPASARSNSMAAGLLREINAVFENTKLLEDASFLCFVQALVQLLDGVNNDDLKKVGEVKSLSVERIRQVSLLNTNRLVAADSSVIWDLVISHLVDIVLHAAISPTVRTQALEVFADIECQSTMAVEQLNQSDDLQLRLLMPLKRVLMEGKALELRVMALETLNKLLQNNGHDFTAGWGVIFEMLNSVCDAPAPLDVQLIRTAFPCLQLICADYLSLLSPHCLRLCIRTLGLFGQQREDLNISLTSIGLLWNISDFLLSEKLQADSASTAEDSTINGDDSEQKDYEDEIGDTLDYHTVTELWLTLLLQLKSLGADTRPEVRNSANQSLFRTVAANGGRQQPHTWERCLESILFPLVDAVDTSSGMPSLRSKVNTEPPRRPHHKSKSLRFDAEWAERAHVSQEKQWDETRTLVVNGIIRVFRENLETLTLLPDFTTTWMRLLSYVRVWLLYGSYAVAQTAVDSWKYLLGMPTEVGGEQGMSSRLWDELPEFWWIAWDEWERVGQGVLTSLSDSSIPRFTTKVLTPFVQSFHDIYAILGTGFGLDDVERLLVVLAGLLSYPQLDEFSSDFERPTPVQAAVLDVLSNLDLDTAGVPQALVQHYGDLSKLARRLSGKDEIMLLENGKRERKATFVALSILSVQKAVDIFLKYEADAGMYTPSVFSNLCLTLAEHLQRRYSDSPTPDVVGRRPVLWKVAGESGKKALVAGLPVITRLCIEKKVPLECYERAWDGVFAILEAICSPSQEFPSGMSKKERLIEEDFDISLFVTIYRLALGSASTFSAANQDFFQLIMQRLMGVIEKASLLYHPAMRKYFPALSLSFSVATIKEEGKPEDWSCTGEVKSVHRERFGLEALKLLFQLCSLSTDIVENEQEKRRLASFAAPVLLKRCRKVMSNYVADLTLHQSFPFQRIRRQEICFVLQNLLELQMFPEIQDSAPSLASVKGSDAHLWSLYPLLTQILSVAREPGVRNLTSICLQRCCCV